MSARSFRSVGWVAGIAATALGCYMVNLQVASERAALEEVETRIVLAQRDIRLLQTEIGTRGRLAQLEKWNVKVLALSAPAANQFVEGGFQLATLVAPKKIIDPAAPVVLASAPAPERKPVINDDAAVAAPSSAPADLMHVASLKRDIDDEAVRPMAKPAPAPKKTVEKPSVAASKAADKTTKLAKKETESSAKPAKASAAVTKPAASVTGKPAASKTSAVKTAAAKPKPKEAKTAQ